MTDDGQIKYYELWLGDDLIRFSYEEIKADPQLELELKKIERKKAENELQFFVPHGEAKNGYDCGFQMVSMADWINDREHTVCMNCSGNRVGKTCHAVVKKALKIIPCDKKWQIYKTGKIKFYEWQGKKTLVVLAYDKGKLQQVMWPEIQKWFPAYELGEYRQTFLGGTKEPSWDRHPRIDLKCGSKIFFFTYEQPASVCSGIVASEIFADETMPLSFWNELNQRGRTSGGVWWDISYTPHKVEGRVDSGTNSFLHDMWKGINTRGHSVLRSRISVDEVPNRIIPESEKKKMYRELVVVPKQLGDQVAIRDGMARYYGIADQLSGLFYPEVHPDIHFVDWTYDDIKNKGWTHYRSVDYGYANPTACGLWAVSPNGDLFMYDEYYVAGKDAVEHAPLIIEKCGNERKLVKKMLDKESGIYYDMYEEVFKTQRYIRTWLDWHSFQTAGGSGRPVSFFFTIGGLRVCESVKLRQEQRAQNMRAMLKIDKNRRHMVTGKPGAPRIYISNKCVKWRWEWERCVVDIRAFGNERHNPMEVKQNKDDHLIDATEYIACENPRYLGSYVDRKPREVAPISRHGGY
ncbi:MAG: hypothetical protein WC364_12005 [Eubacteriales bacterium]|jgi:hypothetical protein